MKHPESVLQFGAGNFLRAFADLILGQAACPGGILGRVVVVQSTGDDRAKLLNQSGGRYHVVIRGIEDGRPVDRVEVCDSVSRALVASDEWAEVLAVARSPELRYVISNTTEAGYALDPADAADAVPPKSFPAKMLAVLQARFAAGLPGVFVIPCELIEGQATKLRDLVVGLARQWGEPDAFAEWLTTRCHWLNTLVDRIVPGRPAEHPLLETDPLLLMAEPYALWAVEKNFHGLPPFNHPAIVWTPDVLPYFLRKVRILNGAHTALLCHVGLQRFATVLEAVNDADTVNWLRELLATEIVPVLRGRVDEPDGFARLTLDRFRNPYLAHKLKDIALHHATKKQVRLVPTRREFVEMFGRVPPLLDEALRGDRVAT